MDKKIEDEIDSSRALGYNLGIKLVRGAYMVEERAISAADRRESPIWDEIDHTHSCYNKCAEMLIESVSDADFVLLATHNTKTVDLAKKLMKVPLDSV